MAFELSTGSHSILRSARRATSVAAAFGLGAATALGLPSPDATLLPRQRFAGFIATTTDQDRIVYPGLAGSELTVIAYAVAGAEVRPRIVVSQNGAELAPGISLVMKDGREHRAIRVKVPADGEVAIDVRGADDTRGDYRVKVRERLPSHHVWKGKVAAGGTQHIEFTARAGAKAHLELTRLGDSTEPVLAPKLVSPDGAELVLDGLVATQESGVAVGPVALLADGKYRVEIASNASAAELLTLRVDIAAEKGDAGTVSEAAGAVTVRGDVYLEFGDWIGDELATGDFIADELVVQFAPGTTGEALATRLGLQVAAVAPGGVARLRRPASGVPRLAATAPERAWVARWCDAARGAPGVIAAEPNRIRRGFAVPNDPLFPQQWDYARAGFDTAADLESGAATRTIAVLDTGIRAEHPDLAGRIGPGYDFVSDSWNAADGNGLDSDPTDPLLSQGTHGTHVAGTIVAQRDNALGIAGAVGAGRVMPLRVLGVLGGTDFDIAQAILYAARLPNVSGLLPSQRAEVINMSLGGPNPSALLDSAVKQAIAAGVVVVAAAGNANSKYPMYPAAIEGVIAVAATDALDQRAYYSSFGKHVSLAAPGGDPWVDSDGDGFFDGILSTTVDGFAGPVFTRKSGTSMASPHVAAAAFLLRSANPQLSPLEVKAYLAAGATDLGTPGKDKYFGYGLLDAGRALAHAKGIAAEAPGLFTFPSSIEFGITQSEIDAVVVPTGMGPAAQLSGASCSAFWVSLTANPGTTPATIHVAVDRAGLLPGTWTTSLLLETTLGPREIPISIEVPPTAGPPEVSRVFVFAWDVVRHHAASIVEVTKSDGGEFEFDALPEGTYRFFAATDFDLDGIAGEDHDYAGAAVHPQTGAAKFELADGTVAPEMTLMLGIGGNVELPKDGSVSLATD